MRDLCSLDAARERLEALKLYDFVVFGSRIFLKSKSKNGVYSASRQADFRLISPGMTATVPRVGRAVLPISNKLRYGRNQVGWRDRFRNMLLVTCLARAN